MSRKHEGRPTRGRQIRERGIEVAVTLDPQGFVLRSHGLAAVDQARHETVPCRSVSASADRGVGRDPIEPGPHVVGHAPGAGLPDQTNERVLEEILSGLAIAGHADQEGENLGPAVLVDGGQDRLVRAATGPRPLECGRGVIGDCRVGRVGHAGVTHTAGACYLGRCAVSVTGPRTIAGARDTLDAMPDLDKKPWSDIVALIGGDVLPLLLIVVVAIFAIRLASLFVHGIVKALLDREATEGTAQELSAVELKKRMDTLDDLGAHAIQFFIVVIAALMVLGKVGLDIGPAVAGLGVIGIAVGFGAQTLVRDYLNGAFILAENQFSKGDVVRLAGVAGTVEDFNLRRTTVRDLDGVVHTIPNGEIKVASNLTRVWSRINQDITVAYGTDMDRAIEVVDAVGQAMADDPIWKRRILETPRVERVEALAEYGVTLKILGSVRAPEQWAASGEFRKRLLAALHANGIEIPRPQRVILSRDPSAASAGGTDEAAPGADTD